MIDLNIFKVRWLSWEEHAGVQEETNWEIKIFMQMAQRAFQYGVEEENWQYANSENIPFLDRKALGIV